MTTATEPPADYSDLRALFINCTLKRSPEPSNTQGLIDVSAGIMRSTGSTSRCVRAVDHDIATGVWPDMTEHGWATDDWPEIFEQVFAANILVLAGPIWLGDNSSVMKQVTNGCTAARTCSTRRASTLLRQGRGCLITGNEDGVKHCAQNALYTLQHIGYTIPPQADAGWIGEAGPGPSYLDPGSGGPENDFTNRNTTFMTWNLMHLARMLADGGGVPVYGNIRADGMRGAAMTFRIPNTAEPAAATLSPRRDGSRGWRKPSRRSSRGSGRATNRRSPRSSTPTHPRCCAPPGCTSRAVRQPRRWCRKPGSP